MLMFWWVPSQDDQSVGSMEIRISLIFFSLRNNQKGSKRTDFNKELLLIQKLRSQLVKKITKPNFIRGETPFFSFFRSENYNKKLH